jgi:hypothetical protein
VLQMWDFTPRSVSIPAAMFLRENFSQPLFSATLDLSATARAKANKSLTAVTAARRRASLLRDYVVQCPNFPNGRCCDQDRIHAVTLATRSHLLADDDTVSLQDCVDVEKGELLKFIQAFAAPWADHVLCKCLLCHEKVCATHAYACMHSRTSVSLRVLTKGEFHTHTHTHSPAQGHCCEICRSEERLFPWDEPRISTCEHCDAISHR